MLYQRVRSGLPALFFAVLFFFGYADLVFATRVHAMNFRWGQLLLLAGALASAVPLYQHLKAPGELRRTLVRVLGAWALFFAVYGLAALVSEQKGAGLVKLAWGVINIGGAAVVCLVGARKRSALLEGFAVATALTSLVIWADALVMFWADLPGPFFGLAQRGYMYDGVMPMRPHAFYYEPSYAGAMLAFAVPVLFVATETMPRWCRALFPALAISATVLCGARTGIAGVACSVALAGGWALVWKRDALRPLLLSLGLSVMLLAVFFSAPRASVYLRYLTGPLGMSASAHRMFVPKGPQGQTTIEARTSEGARLASFLDGLHRWREKPVLGWGVNNGAKRAVGPPELDRAVHTGAPNTWIEVMVESGTLGLLTFALALLSCLGLAFQAQRRHPLWGFLLAGCLTHLLINLNMTQTFPRLDYWLVFFCILRTALPDPLPEVAGEAAQDPAGEASGAGLAGRPAT